MSIRARIEDSLILWFTDRREGALLATLVAAVAEDFKNWDEWVARAVNVQSSVPTAQKDDG